MNVMPMELSNAVLVTKVGIVNSNQFIIVNLQSIYAEWWISLGYSKSQILYAMQKSRIKSSI